MNLKLEEKKNIVSFISNLSDVASKKGWISSYDPEADSLSIRKNKLSKDARKKYINDEFAFYLNRDKNVEGIFMEYFLSNFVSHHKDFKKVVKKIKKSQDKEEIIKFKNKELINKLESVMLNSVSIDNCKAGA